MKRVLSLIMMTVFVTLTSSASANVVIDDFTMGGTATDGTASSGTTASAVADFTYTYTANSTFGALGFFSPNGGNAQGSLPNAGGGGIDVITLAYTFASPFDLTAAGTNSLILDLFNGGTDNPLNVTVGFDDGADGIDETLAFVVPGSGPIGIAGTSLVVANASSITNLLVTITGIGTDFAAPTFTSVGATITAVPEPASMLLLGLTSLGGAAIYRRRRRGAAAVVAVAA